MKRKRIAMIGAGISGLTCAYTLARSSLVTVFEAADYIGGHTHTVKVEKDGELSDIDTGFIVFNDRTYPRFMALMKSLGVSYKPTEMSFSVRNDQIDLEYNGNNINSLFAQRSNLLRLGFWSMLKDIVRFNREVRSAAHQDSTQSIGQFLQERRYSTLFRDAYLLPMISAIWSMGLERCLDFPLKFFVSFFENHGLLDIFNRPQWYTIDGGSSCYITPLTAGFHERIRLNSPVQRVDRTDSQVQVSTAGEVSIFDEVIFACHGNQALSLLARPTAKESELLGTFQTSRNDVILHTDTTLLPKRKLGWASWNYNVVDAARQQTTLTYNMNILQRLQKKHTYLVTLNQEVAKDQILQCFTYNHPIFTLDSISAQQQWAEISGKNNSHYCGAYWFNGFHEDGVRSALRVCAAMGVQQ